MKRIISIVISLLILALIYWKIDITKLAPVFANANPVWMVISLGMVIPLTLVTSWRLCILMPARGQLSFGESNKLILAASVLNLVLPSKMGDIAKAFFMRDKGNMGANLALSLVIFEKACDMLSLLLWCVFGLVWLGVSSARGNSGYRIATGLDAFPALHGFSFTLINNAPLLFVLCFAAVFSMLVLGIAMLSSRKLSRLVLGAPDPNGNKRATLSAAWEEMHGYFWGSPARLFQVTTVSIFVWLLHLLQIWFFILALRAYTPFLANLALSPLAILAGLLPLTFAGVGVRDAALVLLYAPYFSPATAASLGILCTARYVLPAIGGLPFAGGYMQQLRASKNGGAAAR